jgi:hypothetical protein
VGGEYDRYDTDANKSSSPPPVVALNNPSPLPPTSVTGDSNKDSLDDLVSRVTRLSSERAESKMSRSMQEQQQDVDDEEEEAGDELLDPDNVGVVKLMEACEYES